MLRLKGRRSAIIALLLCMMLCVGTAIGINLNKKSVTASADTMTYSVAETYSAKVSQSMPATISLTETAGQYYMTARITAVNGETIAENNGEYYDLIATIGEESTFLNYNYSTHTFTGVVRAEDYDTLILITTSSDTLSLDITLGDLFIGKDNNYALENVQIPTNSSLKLNLENVTANDYSITVDLGYEFLEYDTYLYAQVGDKEPVLLTIDDDYYSAYTGRIVVTDSTKTLTIISTSPQTLNVNITLNQIEGLPELPSVINLEMWQTQTYRYTAVEGGYYSLNIVTPDKYTEVSIIFKEDVEAFDGLNVTENNFPLFMEAGKDYYFDLTLVNATSDFAIIITAVKPWDRPIIMADTIYPVPVTAEDRDTTAMDLQVRKGTYNLSISGIPINYYVMDITVTVYIAGLEPIYLNQENHYTADVGLDFYNRKIFLTTSDTVSTVLSIYINNPLEKKYINVGEPTEITVPSVGENDSYNIFSGRAIYYFDCSEYGYYEITLTDLNGALISVESSVSALPIVDIGHTEGAFKLRYQTGQIILEFVNHGYETVRFTAIVNQLFGDYDLSLGTNDITIEKGNTVYYFEGIAIGDYLLTVTNLPTSATLTVDGEKLVLNSQGKAVLSISGVQDNIGFITVMFTSSTAANISLTVRPLSEIPLNEEISITTEYDYYYVTAYYIYLEPGIYEVQLTTPEMLYVMVTANNEIVTTYSNDSGVFTVEESGYVALRFICFTYTMDNTFQVIVLDNN